MMSSMDAEAEMEGLFGGEDQGQEEEAQTQSLTQEGLSEFMMCKINISVLKISFGRLPQKAKIAQIKSIDLFLCS